MASEDVVGMTVYVNQKRPSDDIFRDGSVQIEWTAYNVNNLKINTEFTVECPTYQKTYFES